MKNQRNNGKQEVIHTDREIIHRKQRLLFVIYFVVVLALMIAVVYYYVSRGSELTTIPYHDAVHQEPPIQQPASTSEMPTQ